MPVHKPRSRVLLKNQFC